jgi:hypothetical protein
MKRHEIIHTGDTNVGWAVGHRTDVGCWTVGHRTDIDWTVEQRTDEGPINDGSVVPRHSECVLTFQCFPPACIIKDCVCGCVFWVRVWFVPSSAQLIQITNSSSSFSYLNGLCSVRGPERIQRFCSDFSLFL